MNHNNISQEITILRTRDNEEFELEISYEDFLKIQTEAKGRGEDGVNLSRQRRFLKFSSIKDIIGRTRRLSLPPPPREKHFFELWSEEKRMLLRKNPKKYKELYKQDQIRRKKASTIIKIAMEKTEKGRKKRFLEDRKKILADLAKKEKAFWLDTTLSKLEEHEKLKIEKIKNNF